MSALPDLGGSVSTFAARPDQRAVALVVFPLVLMARAVLVVVAVTGTGVGRLEERNK